LKSSSTIFKKTKGRCRQLYCPIFAAARLVRRAFSFFETPVKQDWIASLRSQ
jgi:hypothetical protein